MLFNLRLGDGTKELLREHAFILLKDSVVSHINSANPHNVTLLLQTFDEAITLIEKETWKV